MNRISGFRRPLYLVLLLFAGLFFLSPELSDSSGPSLISGLWGQEQGVETHAQHSDSGSHHGEFSKIFELFAIVLIFALIGRYLANKFKQPPVLGELIIGILLGLILFQVNKPIMVSLRYQEVVAEAMRTDIEQGVPWEEAVQQSLDDSRLPEKQQEDIRELLLEEDFGTDVLLVKSLKLLSELGVLVLLFMVGLESSVEGMIKNGRSSAMVAVIGVIAPFVLGYFVVLMILPSHNSEVAIFTGAALCATSIGITARVFKDMGTLRQKESQIVLGAAVIDDILGLIVLAVVSGIIVSGSLDLLSIGAILFKSLAFIVLVIAFGQYGSRWAIRIFEKLDSRNVTLLYPFVMLMLFAWLADLIGLASIVGAFAAGLIIKEEYFLATEAGVSQNKKPVETIIAPIEGILAPVFFVVMGMQTDITTFANPEVLVLGLVLTVAAVAGKLVAALGIPKSLNRWTVGFGMVPRGEVGLIFASIGKSLGVLDSELFSVIIIMVMLTTLLTPPLLKWSSSRASAAQQAPAA